MNGQIAMNHLPDGPVHRLFRATADHDVDAIVACFADDYVNESPNHPDRGFTGRGQVRKNWTALFAGVPDLRVHTVNTATGPDGQVWVEWGTAGTSADGGTVAMAGVLILTVTADLITAARFYLEPVEHSSGTVDDAVRAMVTGVPDTRRPGAP
ncbi:hypothetical protein ART_0472 [Arthrobacter sp. PAMC 25486]|uniref:nuclear transport factor 2 family protein n=1 Tax=Arthrobacter sp. PAMC 25486 TaxID=1494608 RepID=UPI000535F658|nr:nuclear transport factor 2 family protein [Arthrobacter sp. PAMC 25486]AIY00071.1 hypothetical protein ART_0472 [Arthrobacter sp. PAMC 25486]